MSSILVALILPPGLFIVLQCYLAWHLKKTRSGAAVALSLLAFFTYLLSCPQMASFLEFSFGWGYPVSETQIKNFKPDYILVFGGGVNARVPEYQDLQPSESSWQRVRYAAYLESSLHIPVIASGGKVSPNSSEAKVMAKALQALGVEEVELENASVNTWSNIEYVLENFGGKRYLMVTSTVHAPRVAWAARSQGAAFLMAPTGFYEPPAGLNGWLPSIEALDCSYSVGREVLGRIYYALGSVEK